MTLAADLGSIRPDVLPGIRIADIIVGERARKDYGDLTGLMDSIREVGLLQPIGLTPGSHLLFGGRRLEACRRLGWESIPFVRPSTREDALSLLKAERDENTCRKDMTPEELVDLGLRLEELERPRAEARQREGQERGREARWSGSGSREPEPSDAYGKPSRTAIEVGAALGLAPATYKRMKAVVTTARDDTATPEVQEVAQAALADLNAGRTTPTSAYNRMREVGKARPEPAKPPAPPRYGPRRKHLQVLQAMTTALAGIAGAAEEITELDNSVTQEEATQLVRDLSRQIRSLNQIRNLLKERT